MDLRNEIARSRDEYLNSLDPVNFQPAAEQYIRNRIERAFIEGWHSAEKIAVQALNDIINPINKFQKDLKEGERLNGGMAVALSNDPEFLKKMAKEALDRILK